MSPFKVGGPLTAHDAAVYVERDADRETIRHLGRMDYLMFSEPRQQGKTSLINRLKYHSLPRTHVLAYLFCEVHSQSEKEWYQKLGEELLDQHSELCDTQSVAKLESSDSWYRFLRNLAAVAHQQQRYVVIALDEVGAIDHKWSEAFFAVLHQVFCERGVWSQLEHVTFILSGAYNPRDLISDPNVSPFNIATQVYLADFTQDQVRELVGKGNRSEEQMVVLADRIHYWTGGVPYLTQWLCAHLGLQATPDDIDSSVQLLRKQDPNCLPPLLKRLNQDDNLRAYTRRILAGEQIKFFPAEHPDQSQLELLGVIKEGDGGYCAVRNHIFELALKEMLDQERSPISKKPIQNNAAADTDTVNAGGENGPVVVNIFKHYKVDHSIKVGDVTGNTGIGFGNNMDVNVNKSSGASADEIARLFAVIHQQIQARKEDPNVDKEELTQTVQRIEQETLKGEQASAGKLERWLNTLAGMASDIGDVVIATLTNPAVGITTVIRKVAEKAKSETGGK